MLKNKNAILCMACGEHITSLDSAHLLQCCGLTLQEYSIRYKLPLDVLLPQTMLNYEPPVSHYPAWQTPQARSAIILSALKAVGCLNTTKSFYVIDGDIRRLDQLLWLAGQLADCGFVFHQTYHFDQGRHRVIARNALKAARPPQDDLPTINLATCPSSDFLLWLAIALAYQSDFYQQHIFLRFVATTVEPLLSQRLQSEFGIHLSLAAAGSRLLIQPHPQ